MSLGIATAAKLHPSAKDGPQRLDQIVGAGAKIIRTSIAAKQCEPKMGSGVFDWSSADELFAAVKARGLMVCLTLQGWLDGHALDQDHVDAFGKWVAAAAARYNDPTLILGYENQNEIMLGTKYDTNPTPERYVPLQRVMWEGCKASSDLLVGTSARIGQSDWMERCYTAGIKGLFDVAVEHPYTKPMSPTESMKAQHGGWWAMHLTRLAMIANGESDKKIWATEYGSPTGGNLLDRRTEAQQAADLTDAAHRFAKNPALEHLFWFDGWDTLPQTNDPGDWMGLYRADGSEKLAVATFRSLVPELEAA